MPNFLRFSFFCCLLFCVSSSALAHRVHLFAIVEGEEIVADCRFSKTSPAQRVWLRVFNNQTGSLLLEGKTDDQGAFRFPIPRQILEHPVDLLLKVNAGSGHMAEWMISASEIPSQYAAAPPAPSTEQQNQKMVSQVLGKKEKAGEGRIEITEQRLKEIINHSLDTRLTPIQAMLMAQQADGPGFVEIVGGIGWIFGLFGIAAFIMSRKTNREKGD